MPQISLEYSTNAKVKTSWKRIFHSIHGIIHKETGVDMENCKSRAISRDSFYIGEGGDAKAFVHLEVALLAGKTEKVKHKTGELLLHLLGQDFEGQTPETALQITVELRDISRENYFKFPKGTLSKP